MSWLISTLGSTSSHYSVFQNGEKKSTMWVNGSQNNYDSSSHTVILKLQKGDDVTIKHTGSDKLLMETCIACSQDFYCIKPMLEVLPLLENETKY